VSSVSNIERFPGRRVTGKHPGERMEIVHVAGGAGR